MNPVGPASRISRFALIAVAAASLLVGIGGAWWRLAPSAVSTQGSEMMFALTFPDPDGQPLPLARWKGRLLVVNFWATWCPPCVEEMPDLQQVRDEYAARDVEIIGIGIDSPSKIKQFREEHGISLPLLVAGAGGSELGRALGNSAGALPYTVLLSREGRVLRQKLGQIKPAELRAWLDAEL